jgi:hypothetical protein
MELTLRVIDAAGNVRAEAHGTNEAHLVHRSDYAEGESVVLEAAEGQQPLILSLDDAIAPAFVYLREKTYALAIPFGPKKVPYSPKCFSGTMHRLSVRLARPEEIATRRNLAFNPYDDHANKTLFPHGSANVETRGEAVFAARNAIDGEKANDDHGFWPYTSWGINRDPDAALTIDFGRKVRLDEAVFYLRADFPHDAWWERASLTFSDGETITLPLVKSAAAQHFALEPRIVEWVRLHSLIKADDPSPYPALTQIEFWGTETGEALSASPPMTA